MAGKEFKATISINGQVEASVIKAVANISGELEAVQKASIEAAAATDKLTATIDLQSDELKKAKKAYQDYILSGDKSSEQAKELAGKIKKLARELRDNESKLSDAEEAADKLAGGLGKAGKAAKESKDGFTVMKGAISNLIANGISTLISKCGDAIRSLGGLSSETQEYREDMSKLKTAFTSLGHSASAGTAVYKELYSVFGEEDRAVEAAQQIAALADNQQEMTRMVDIATGAWARWGDSLATESLMEAMNSTAKIGSVQGTLADALEWSGVNLDDFNKQLEWMNSEEERSEYILKTLEGLYGKAADNYRETNASIIEARKANSDYTDTVAQLGAIIEPITTRVQKGFTRILQKIIDLVTNGDIEAFGDKIDAAFGDFVDNLLPKIIGAMDWIANNTDLLAGIAVAIGVVAAAIGVMNAVMAVQNAIMMASPVTWIVMAIIAAIAALIAIIVVCVKYWDQISAAAQAAVNWIIDAWHNVAAWINENVVQPIAGFFSGLWEGLKGMVDGIVAFFTNGFNSLIGIVKAPINAIIGIINGAIDGINSIGFDIPDWVPFIGGQAFRINIPKLPMLATGGFTDGVSIAGEAGTEAVISFDPKYRQENLSYWAKAGRMLGADTSDFFLGVGGGTHTSIDLGGVTFAPNITVTGHATKETIMQAIEDEYPEFLDMLEAYFMERSVNSYA